jgi:hypothetical protein
MLLGFYELVFGGLATALIAVSVAAAARRKRVGTVAYGTTAILAVAFALGVASDQDVGVNLAALPYVDGTGWTLLAEGVANVGGSGSRDSPYLVIGSRDSPAVANAQLKAGISEQGWFFVDSALLRTGSPSPGLYAIPFNTLPSMEGLSIQPLGQACARIVPGRPSPMRRN